MRQLPRRHASRGTGEGKSRGGVSLKGRFMRFIDEILLIPRDDSLSGNKLGSRKAEAREGQA